jgi:membrane protein insertase Oxa1/YidC/SpoIIIJ
MMQKQMVYFFPFLTVIILMGLPSALGIYWAVGSMFMIVQQYIIFKKPTLQRAQIFEEKRK